MELNSYIVKQIVNTYLGEEIKKEVDKILSTKEFKKQLIKQVKSYINNFIEEDNTSFIDLLDSEIYNYLYDKLKEKLKEIKKELDK